MSTYNSDVEVVGPKAYIHSPHKACHHRVLPPGQYRDQKDQDLEPCRPAWAPTPATTSGCGANRLQGPPPGWAGSGGELLYVPTESSEQNEPVGRYLTSHSNNPWTEHGNKEWTPNAVHHKYWFVYTSPVWLVIVTRHLSQVYNFRDWTMP